MYCPPPPAKHNLAECRLINGGGSLVVQLDGQPDSRHSGTRAFRQFIHGIRVPHGIIQSCRKTGATIAASTSFRPHISSIWQQSDHQPSPHPTHNGLPCRCTWLSCRDIMGTFASASLIEVNTVNQSYSRNRVIE